MSAAGGVSPDPNAAETATEALRDMSDQFDWGVADAINSPDLDLAIDAIEDAAPNYREQPGPVGQEAEK